MELGYIVGNKMNALIIFIAVLTLFAIGIIVIEKFVLKKKGLSQFCQKSSDCPSGMKCIPNPENPGKNECFPINKKFCVITPFTALKECDPTDKNSCQDCLNIPSFNCVVVNKNKPYTWKQGNKTISIPDSSPGKGWCLPDVDTRQFCNPFTADYVLEQTGENEYSWGCYCKYPNLFDHSGGPNTLSDCTFVRACGTPEEEGNLVVPTSQECTKDSDCGSTGKCLYPKSPGPCGSNATGPKFCHIPWQGDTQKTINPLDGQCICDADKELTYQCIDTGAGYYEMNCVKNTCGQYPTSTNCQAGGCRENPPDKCCVCPTGYLRCPDDIPIGDSPLCNHCYDYGPSCIPDPCRIGDDSNGYYDKNRSGGPGCVCPGENMAPVADTDSPVGEICQDLCRGNGPCANRGTCYVDRTEVNPVAKCCNCVCPYTNDGDPTETCSGDNNKRMEYNDCDSNDQCCSNNCTKTIAPPQQGFCMGAYRPVTSPCPT